MQQTRIEHAPFSYRGTGADCRTGFSRESVMRNAARLMAFPLASSRLKPVPLIRSRTLNGTGCDFLCGTGFSRESVMRNTGRSKSNLTVAFPSYSLARLRRHML